MCPTDYYVTAMISKFEVDGGSDDTALNGVGIRCRKLDYSEPVDKTVYGG